MMSSIDIRLVYPSELVWAYALRAVARKMTHAETPVVVAFTYSML